MKTFNADGHPTGGLEAVKVGSSWPALFFGFFWMLAKNLWKFAGLWIVAYAACSLLGGVAKNLLQGAPQTIAYLLVVVANVALWLLHPLKDNQWRLRCWCVPARRLHAEEG